jgi:ribose transport system permease protein
MKAEAPREIAKPEASAVSRSRLITISRVKPARYSALLLAAIFVAIFSGTQPQTYPTVTTLRLVLEGQVPTGILALALLIPFAAGAFDISVGANLALSMVLVAHLTLDQHMNVALASLVGVIGSTLVGFVNGFLIVRLHIHSFIATLGVSEVLSAITLYVSDNNEISGFSQSFQSITQHRFLGITVDVYLLLLIALVIWYILEHTPIGRYLYATGGNLEASRLAGIAVDRVIWGSFVASAFLSGIAGVVYASEVGLFSPAFGQPFLFPAFAAVFFGATQVKSRANVWGTVAALYALAFGVQGLQLTFFGSNFWVTPLFDGVTLVLAVAVAARSGVVGRRTRPVAPKLSDEGGDSSSLLETRESGG